MSNMEEKLWAYIDGTGTPQEREEIAQQIVQNDQLRLRYEELLRLHQEFSQLELDEPPIAFTYNVMETIRAEEALKPLKAGINVGIVRFISLFFIFTIVALIGITIANMAGNGSVHDAPSVHLNIDSTITQLFKGPLIKCFMLFDVVIALFLADTWLRRWKWNENV